MGGGQPELPASSRLDRFLGRDVLERADFSAAVAMVSVAGSVIGQAARGFRDTERRNLVEIDDFFDLASLTKPWVATVALELDSRRELALATEIGAVLERVPDWLARRSLEDLLRHRSGLPAWAPLYALGVSREAALERALEQFARAPGQTGVYSDLGYQVWAAGAAAALGRSAVEIFQSTGCVVGADGLAVDGRALVTGEPIVAPVSFMDTAKERDLAAGLGLSVGVLKAPEPGVPQDGNARFLGGICGHAGLFGTARAMLRLAEEWRSPRHLDPAVVSRAVARDGIHGLGWRLESFTADVFSRRSFGHTGFVGGSTWIDPDRELSAVLLGHRRDPFLDLGPMRTAFHVLVVELAE